MEKPFLIGICGGSGGGKTSFLRQLREAFPIHQVAIISQDDYYKPREEQEQDDLGFRNFDLPKSIDKKRMLSDIKQLINGKRLETKEYTFNNENMEGVVKYIEPAPIIVVEGLFVFHYKKISALFDLKIFVHAKDPYKIARRILRDQKERNYPLDDVIYRYQAHVLPAYERYIAPHMSSADLIVNNNTNFEMGFQVVCGFIRDKVGDEMMK